MTWRALVLSGGGVKGEFQVGAIQCLTEQTDWEFDFFTGVSVGALNIAPLAQHDTLAGGFEELRGIWDGIRRNGDIYRGSKPLGAILSLFSDKAIARDSIYDVGPVRRLIERHVQWERFRKPFAVGVASLTDGNYYLISNHQELFEESKKEGLLPLTLSRKVPGSIPDRISDFILASASMPLLFPPVDIYGHRFVDGGVRDVTPLSAAFGAAKLARRFVDPRTMEIYLISTLPKRLPLLTRSGQDSGQEILARSLGIMVHEIFENDVQIALTLNELAQAEGEFLRIPVHHVRPEEALPIDELDFDNLAGRQAARKLGYQAMLEFLASERPALLRRLA